MQSLITEKFLSFSVSINICPGFCDISVFHHRVMKHVDKLTTAE